MVFAVRDRVEGLDRGEKVASRGNTARTVNLAIPSLVPGDTHQGMSLVPWWMSW